jgi:hypothetical protein
MTHRIKNICLSLLILNFLLTACSPSSHELVQPSAIPSFTASPQPGQSTQPQAFGLPDTQVEPTPTNLAAPTSVSTANSKPIFNTSIGDLLIESTVGSTKSMV